MEIFRHSHSSGSFDFNCPIDNTGLNVIGNIVDTTVSDERLKENIEDFEKECLDCKDFQLQRCQI